VGEHTNEEVTIGQISGLIPYTTSSHGKFCPNRPNHRINRITHSVNSKIQSVSSESWSPRPVLDSSQTASGV